MAVALAVPGCGECDCESPKPKGEVPEGEVPEGEVPEGEVPKVGDDQAEVPAGEPVICPAGTTSETDPATGVVTGCIDTLCVANQYVLDHACMPCADRATNAAGDSASGPNTTCDGACQPLFGSSCEQLVANYLKASNTGSDDQFGWSVSLSADGHTLAVGARGEASNARGFNQLENNESAPNSGAVYVFTRDPAGTWSQQAYLKASNTDKDDQFGYSVALSADGDTLAIGAPYEDSNARGVNQDQENDIRSLDAGAVYVFTRTGVTWSQQAYIKASNTGAGDQFGFSVALSAHGDTLAVGARGEASSAKGVNQDQDQDQDDDRASYAGAVYVYGP